MHRHVQRCLGKRRNQRQHAGNVAFHVRSATAVEFAIRFAQFDGGILVALISKTYKKRRN